MSEKDDDEQSQKAKLFMTENSGLEQATSATARDGGGQALRPKSSKINSATTMQTADDAEQDDEDGEGNERDDDEDEMNEEEEEDEDEEEEDEGDYDDYDMDGYPENPFYEYQLPTVVRPEDGEEAGNSLGATGGVEKAGEESVNELEQAEEEVRPLSAIAPKVFQQPDDGNVQIEISSTPAFQCLEEVRRFKRFFI